MCRKYVIKSQHEVVFRIGRINTPPLQIAGVLKLYLRSRYKRGGLVILILLGGTSAHKPCCSEVHHNCHHLVWQ